MAAAVCCLLEALRSHPHLQRLSMGLSLVSGQLLHAPGPAPAAPDVEVRGCCTAAVMQQLLGSQLCQEIHVLLKESTPVSLSQLVHHGLRKCW